MTFGWLPPLVNSVLQRWTKISSVHYCEVIMGAVASKITSLTIVYSTVYLDADQSIHQNSALLVFVRGIHHGPANSPHKWPVTRKMFPFDDVIMDSPVNTWLKMISNDSGNGLSQIQPQATTSTNAGGGLLPEGTKLLTKPMWTSHQWGSVEFASEEIYNRYLTHQSLNHFQNHIHVSTLSFTSPWGQCVK